MSTQNISSRYLLTGLFEEIGTLREDLMDPLTQSMDLSKKSLEVNSP